MTNLKVARRLANLQYLAILRDDQELIGETYLLALNAHKGIVLRAAAGEELTDLEKSQLDALKGFWGSWVDNILDRENWRDNLREAEKIDNLFKELRENLGV